MPLRRASLVSARVLAGVVAIPAILTGAEPVRLRSLDPPVLLPDGSEFRTWEVPLEFVRTYHVDGSSPAASDDNPGTAERPFRTIQRAADVLLPGERVVVAGGIYRERVRPRRGGDGPARMIGYEAAPGAEVVLSGSAAFRPEWSPSAPEGTAAVPGTWEAPLDPSLFEGYRPFEVENVTEAQFATMPWAEPLRGRPPCTLTRGLVFQGGRLLDRVASYEMLAGKDGAVWVDRGRKLLHVRPLGGADPRKETFEVTTRETVFAPEEPGLGFIRVKGFTAEMVAGPFPWEQVGAISTTRGHHWIIEENLVRWANGVGIDVGTQHPRLPQPPQVGHHIVRRNIVTDCGICGICGLGPGGGKEFGLLIEENVLLRNAWVDVESLFETGAIKTHNNVRCLIRRNSIADTLHGPGIWMDWDNRFSRCSENAILRTATMHGAIFVEASFEPNLVAQNVVWETRGRGIYEHDCTRQVFARNLVGRTSGAPFHLQGKITERRIAGRPIESGRHSVLGNVLFENGAPSVFRGPANDVSGNVESGVVASLASDGSALTWSVEGDAPACRGIPALTHDFLGTPRSPGDAPPGPLADLPRAPAAMPLPCAFREWPGAPTLAPRVLNPDGAWCWFQDERALVHDGRLTFASITGHGDAQATSWVFADGSVRIVTLRSDFDADDHNVPALLRRDDGRILAFYARHHREPRMFVRMTERPGDPTSWGPERSFDAGVKANFTYANPFQLPAEGGRIYDFWRGIDFNPTWAASDDGGLTWSQGANVVYYAKGERPYVKYASNGRDTIHLAFTEAHPDRPIRTSLYHAFLRGGVLHASDGRPIRKLVEGPIRPAEATLVYDGARAETGEAWVWDVALDADGRPVIAYTSHPGPEDIRYRWARWDGSAWEDRQIGFGGRRLYGGQEFYAGGISLDPDDPSIVYASSSVVVPDGRPGSGRYEIWRGATRDRGKTWEWSALTSGSSVDNLRPVVPPHHPGKLFVLWFRGSYRSYTDYRTEVVVLTERGTRP